jgi:hypothetical protein
MSMTLKMKIYGQKFKIKYSYCVQVKTWFQNRRMKQKKIQRKSQEGGNANGSNSSRSNDKGQGHDSDWDDDDDRDREGRDLDDDDMMTSDNEELDVVSLETNAVEHAREHSPTPSYSSDRQ